LIFSREIVEKDVEQCSTFFSKRKLAEAELYLFLIGKSFFPIGQKKLAE